MKSRFSGCTTSRQKNSVSFALTPNVRLDLIFNVIIDVFTEIDNNVGNGDLCSKPRLLVGLKPVRLHED